MGPVSIAATHHCDSPVDMDHVSLHFPLVPPDNVILPVVVIIKLCVLSDGTFADVITVTLRVFSRECVKDWHFGGFYEPHASA